MVKLELYNEYYEENKQEIPVCVFNTFNKLNVVTGDSGAGKSMFIENTVLASNNIDGWYFKCNKEVIIITLNNINEIFKDEYKEYLFIFDEEASEKIRCRLKEIKNNKNYFLIMDRSLELKLDVNINAVYTIEMLNSKKINGIIPFIFRNKFK